MRYSVRGQALVTLLVFTAIAAIVISGAVAAIAINSRTTSIMANSLEAYSSAESGIENAALKLLRNPAYIGETFDIANGAVTATVSGTTIKTIQAMSLVGDFRRTVRTTATWSSTVMTLSNWIEVP